MHEEVEIQMVYVENTEDSVDMVFELLEDLYPLAISVNN